MHAVYVDGQEGTTGLRIHEMLAGRGDIEILRIDEHRRRDPVERARLLNAADVVFLCLPDDAAREAVAMVGNPATCIIDASTAHRTAVGWVYGLPELAAGQRDALRSTKRIANPGCHATAFILLVRPLVDAGIVAPGAALTATSITGFSGGGKRMIEKYEHGQDVRLTAPRPYALTLRHKHLPEMSLHGGLAREPIFVPIVGNFYGGLLVNVPLHLRADGLRSDAEAIHQALSVRYLNEPFVRVAALNDVASLDDGFLDPQGCNGSNRCDLFVFADGRRAVLLARLDNLGKGAAGAAVQCMNIQLGIPEGTGLSSREDRSINSAAKFM